MGRHALADLDPRSLISGSSSSLSMTMGSSSLYVGDKLPTSPGGEPDETGTWLPAVKWGLGDGGREEKMPNSRPRSNARL